MLEIKVMTEVFISVEDHEQAQSACSSISLGLARQMSGFPDGEVVGVDVHHYEEASAEEHSLYFAE